MGIKAPALPRDTMDRAIVHIRSICVCSSAVEYLLAKQKVASPNLVMHSKARFIVSKQRTSKSSQCGIK